MTLYTIYFTVNPLQYSFCNIPHIDFGCSDVLERFSASTAFSEINVNYMYSANKCDFDKNYGNPILPLYSGTM